MKPPCTFSDLKRVLHGIAPLVRAEAWDRVGWIIRPQSFRAEVRRILLTIDLTPEVCQEAMRSTCDALITYHPPMLSPLRSLDPRQPRQAALLKLIRRRIAVYSPHTALDHADGGVNDWLAGGILRNDQGRIERMGIARRARLSKPLTLRALARRITSFLGLNYARVAESATGARRIRRIAYCAGAGGSALESMAADAYVTGEMKHHDILDITARGIHVILFEHTHTERGYLPILRRRLRKELPGKVEIRIARSDRDPIRLL